MKWLYIVLLMVVGVYAQKINSKLVTQESIKFYNKSFKAEPSAVTLTNKERTYRDMATGSVFTDSSPLKISFKNEFSDNFPEWLDKFEKQYHIKCIRRSSINNEYTCENNNKKRNIIQLIDIIKKDNNVDTAKALKTYHLQ